MPNQHLPPFTAQKYPNLESVKRDGTPVQTPVWFAEDRGVLYVYTLANAGKVKRIRRHPRIRFATCSRGPLDQRLRYATQPEVALDRFLLAYLSRLQTGHLLAELMKDFDVSDIIPP
jgi:PPOX class probable F420-dependent enzyme